MPEALERSQVDLWNPNLIGDDIDGTLERFSLG